MRSTITQSQQQEEGSNEKETNVEETNKGKPKNNEVKNPYVNYAEAAKAEKIIEKKPKSTNTIRLHTIRLQRKSRRSIGERLRRRDKKSIDRVHKNPKRSRQCRHNSHT